MKTFILIGAVIAAVLSAPVASAQAPAAAQPVSGVETVLYAVAIEDLETAVRAAGLVSERRRNDDGTNDLVVAGEASGLASGGVFTISLKVCNKPGNPPGCLGAQFRRNVTVPTSDRGRYERAAVDFESRYLHGRCFFWQDRMYLDAYAFTDGGVTRKHLERLVVEFDALIDEFSKVYGRTS